MPKQDFFSIIVPIHPIIPPNIRIPLDDNKTAAGHKLS